MIRTTLPAPTSVNRLYNVASNRRVKSKSYKAWIDEAGKVIMAERQSWPIRRLPDSAWFATHFHHPVTAKYDIDNAQKAVHDLLVSMQITPDDRFLFATASERVFDMTGNTFDLSIWTVTEPTKPQFVQLAGSVG